MKQFQNQVYLIISTNGKLWNFPVHMHLITYKFSRRRLDSVCDCVCGHSDFDHLGQRIWSWNNIPVRIFTPKPNPAHNLSLKSERHEVNNT